MRRQFGPENWGPSGRNFHSSHKFMRMIIRTLWICLLLLAGCANPRFFQKREVVVQKEYAPEPLIIKDFVFYDDVVNAWGVSQKNSSQMNADSVFQIFRTSISKLDIPLSYDGDNRNKFDSSFHRNWMRPFNQEVINRVAEFNGESEKSFLVPLIKIRHSHRSGTFITSAGVMHGSPYLLRNTVYLVVYIIKSGTIVYSRSALFLGEEYESDYHIAIKHTLKQQDWDNLVALAMNDYITRIQPQPTAPN